jgi:uncharacterized damage-inducible protein DinB
MTIDEIRRLFRYTEWANAKVIAAARTLAPEQQHKTINSSFTSVVATLAHITLAEWVWLRRWKGESPTAQPVWADGASLADVERELTLVENERHEFLETLSDQDLTRAVDYRSLKGDPFTQFLGDLFVHVVNHSTYHRGQVVTLIRQCGGTPPSTDFLLFARES